MIFPGTDVPDEDPLQHGTTWKDVLAAEADAALALTIGRDAEEGLNDSEGTDATVVGENILPRRRVLWRFMAIPISFTWAFADWRKAAMNEQQRRHFLWNMNRIYLSVSVVLTILLGLLSGNQLSILQQPQWLSWSLLPLLFQISRCNEIFYAFYQDAFDRLDPQRRRGSGLTWSERVRLALNSYAELILNFAIIYALIPSAEWAGSTTPARFTDVLSYSATTITTSGGGALLAAHWPLQLLTSYEIFCGLILLVVCFAIYAGRGVEEVARFDGGGLKQDG